MEMPLINQYLVSSNTNMAQDAASHITSAAQNPTIDMSFDHTGDPNFFHQTDMLLTQMENNKSISIPNSPNQQIPQIEPMLKTSMVDLSAAQFLDLDLIPSPPRSPFDMPHLTHMMATTDLEAAALVAHAQPSYDMARTSSSPIAVPQTCFGLATPASSCASAMTPHFPPKLTLNVSSPLRNELYPHPPNTAPLFSSGNTLSEQIDTQPARGKPKRGRGRKANAVPTPPKQFDCDFEGCNKTFKRSEHLKRHIRSIHTLEKPFPCPYPGCTKKFSRSDNLNQHLRIHRHALDKSFERSFDRGFGPYNPFNVPGSNANSIPMMSHAYSSPSNMYNQHHALQSPIALVQPQSSPYYSNFSHEQLAQMTTQAHQSDLGLDLDGFISPCLENFNIV
jgi:uncharacterized Zn-finger protein